MIEQDAAVAGLPHGRLARFELAAPRHFLLPATLLLLSEKPRHGYGLAKALQELRVGPVDRPSVYRTLAQLERDGLVEASPEGPRTRQGRRAYRLTPQGEQMLRRWMGVIKQERDGLDRVLRRYAATGTVDALLAEVEGGWHTVTAARWSAVSSTSPITRHSRSAVADEAAAGESGPVVRGRFRVVPERSVVLIDARSSVGPITFGAIGVTGEIEASVIGQTISEQPAPTASLEIEVERFESGNSLYDAELLRRIDARRHPTVGVDLRACTRLGSTGRYGLVGEVTFHGVSKPLDGTVAVSMTSDHTLMVRGEQVIDIRDFGVASPTVLMLRIYPDVVVRLQIEAEIETSNRER